MSRRSLIDFLLLAAIWGASFLFMRVASVEFGPLPTAFVRVLVASLFLLPFLLARKQWPVMVTHWRQMFIVGLFNSAIPFALYSFALLHIPTGLSSILNATVPLFGALVAWVWLGDRLPTQRVLGLALGFIGVALLAGDKAAVQHHAGEAVWLPYVSMLACLGATLCYGIAASYTRKYLSDTPPFVNATGSQIGATIGLLIPALFTLPATMPSFKAWGAVVLVGVLCTGLAYALYFRLIQEAGPTRALAVTFVVPLFAVLYGVTLLGEPLTLWMIGCGVLILIGTGLSTGLLDLRKLLGDKATSS